MSPIPEKIPMNTIFITATNACTPNIIYNAVFSDRALSLGGTRRGKAWHLLSGGSFERYCSAISDQEQEQRESGHPPAIGRVPTGETVGR